MSSLQFSILLDGKELVFTAYHFITLRHPEKGLIVEPSHSHSFRVSVKIDGKLDETGLLIDFHAARHCLVEILDQCRNKIFLAMRQQGVAVRKDNRFYRVKFTSTSLETGETAEEAIDIPAEKAVLIDEVNTSAELLALYLGRRYLEKLQAAHLFPPDAPPRLTFTLEECHGTKAAVTI